MGVRHERGHGKGSPNENTAHAIALRKSRTAAKRRLAAQPTKEPVTPTEPTVETTGQIVAERRIPSLMEMMQELENLAFARFQNRYLVEINSHLLTNYFLGEVDALTGKPEKKEIVERLYFREDSPVCNPRHLAGIYFLLERIDLRVSGVRNPAILAAIPAGLKDRFRITDAPFSQPVSR